MLVPLPVSDIMVEPVATCPPDATADRIARRLHQEGISSLVVCDGREADEPAGETTAAGTDDADGTDASPPGADVPVGIVTEGNLIGMLASADDAAAVTAAECMSAPLVTTSPATPIETAAETMLTHGIEHLPVVENGRLVGIVTTVGISAYLPRLVRRARRAGSTSKRRQRVRVDTAYEGDDWTFEFRGDDETQVNVGDVVRFSKPLTDADVRKFAEATGDTNRLHLEEAYAAGTRFGGRIAHGVLGAGLISAALARLPGLVIYLSQDLSFQGPLPVGESGTAVCEVLEDLGRGKFRLRTEVLDEAGTTVVEGTAVVLVDDLPPLPEEPGEAAPTD